MNRIRIELFYSYTRRRKKELPISQKHDAGIFCQGGNFDINHGSNVIHHTCTGRRVPGGVDRGTDAGVQALRVVEGKRKNRRTLASPTSTVVSTPLPSKRKAGEKELKKSRSVPALTLVGASRKMQKHNVFPRRISYFCHRYSQKLRMTEDNIYSLTVRIIIWTPHALSSWLLRTAEC